MGSSVGEDVGEGVGDLVGVCVGCAKKSNIVALFDESICLQKKRAFLSSQLIIDFLCMQKCVNWKT